MDTLPPRTHNNPPDPIEELRARLTETHAPYIERARELLGIEERLPETMDDDQEQKIQDTIKSMTKFTRASEVTRLAANDPHRALIAATDAFFKAWSDKVDALKAKLTKDYLTPYQQKKKDEEQARRDAAAAEARRIQEEEQKRARAEAVALAEAKRKQREAEEAAAAAERERLAAIARAEQERLAAERAAAEAKNKAERDAAAKLQREAAEKAAAEKAKADEAARLARAEQERAAEQRRAAEADAKAARDAADKAKADKAAAEKAAGAKAADMSRSRSDLGSIASLRTVWKHRLIEGQEDKIPRAYLKVHEPSIVAAIRAATTKDGKCDLKIPGIEIYPETSSVVR